MLLSWAGLGKTSRGQSEADRLKWRLSSARSQRPLCDPWLSRLGCLHRAGWKNTSRVSLTSHLGGDRQKQVFHGLIKSSKVTKFL